MKTLSPSVERLDERVAPDLLDIGIGIGISIGIGVGGGTSAYNGSGSSYDNSTHETGSGTCNCWRHSH